MTHARSMNRLRTFFFLFILVSVVSTAFFFMRLANGGAMVEGTRFLMGTVVQIKVPAGSSDEKARAGLALDRAFDEIARVEGAFSVFKVDSEISRINRMASGGPVTTTDEVLGLIERSIEYSRKTKGAFDITVKPLVDLWYHAKVSQRLPADEKVRDALAKVGSQYISIDRQNKTVRFGREGMGLDLGAIAKGYATDQAIKVLKSNGIQRAIVNSGGDIYCLGRRSATGPWKVGIRHPRDKAKIFAELKLKDMAVDTSGDYEKYFTLNGRRYAHIIDPRTGYPVGDNVVSATVTAREAATADALATALCVLGREGLKMIEPMGAGALIIYKEGGALKVEMSKGMEARYEIVRQ